MPVTITTSGSYVAVAGETYTIDPSVTGTVTFTSTATTPPKINVNFADTSNSSRTIEFQNGIESKVTVQSGVHTSGTSINSTAGGSTHVSVGDNAQFGNVTGSGGSDVITTGSGSTVGNITTGDNTDYVTIGGTAGNISTGAGDDQVVLKAGATATSINTGAGGDKVFLGDGSTVTTSVQTYSNAAENDRDFVVGGNNVTVKNSITTGGGDDIVSMGTGFKQTAWDTAIATGDGNDYITVGSGASFGLNTSATPVIDGGAGNDTVPVFRSPGNVTWLTSGGSGSDTGFNVRAPGEGLDYIDASLNDSGWNRVGPQGSTIWTPSPYATGTDATGGTSNSTTSKYLWKGLEGFSSGPTPPIPPVDIPCFTTGTLIETPQGAVAIETLSPGDLVLTRDHGPQPVRWIGSRRLAGAELAENLRPILIRTGALGANTPSSDLLVSPQHRVLVRSRIAHKMFGTDEVLVPAKQLLQIEGIDIAAATEVTYVHMLFDRHEVVISNGAETESLFTGPEALKSLGPAARDEIFAIFPELADSDYAPVAARALVAGRMGRRLAVRHAQNGKPLVG